MELLHRLRDPGGELTLPRPAMTHQGRFPIPVRRRSLRIRSVRFGAALALTLAATAIVGCHTAPSPASDSELRRDLDLADDAVLHTIDLSVIGGRVRVLPMRVRIGAGDAVRFGILDRRVHFVRFRIEEMDAEVLDFLRRTGQDRPPPLLDPDSRLVLLFRDAPPGVYPFEVESSGASARGEIVVRGL